MSRRTTIATRARAAGSAAAAVAGVLVALVGCTAPSTHSAVARSTGQASPAPASSSASWRIVYRTPTEQTELLGIASVSTTDAWVVGTHGYTRPRAVVLHWNGATWRPVRLPAARSFVPSLVMASAASNVWIDGVNRVTGRAELLRFDGSSWRSMPVPSGRWSDNLAAVTGPGRAWLASGGCRPRSWPWNCSSTIEEWTGTRWIASHQRILVSGLAAIGSHVWAVGLTGERPPDGGDGSGRVVLLRQARGGWQRVAGPDATVAAASPAVVATGTELPQLAAGLNRTAWILCAIPGAPEQGTLFRLHAGKWTSVAIPARVGGSVLGVAAQLAADGGTGVWAGPYAHWTGRQWVSVSTVRPGQQGTVFLGLAAGIPGAPGSWAVGSIGPFIVTVADGSGVIAVNGPLPG
jgi:hypothetical protein